MHVHCIYSGTSLLWTPLSQENVNVSTLVRCQSFFQRLIFIPKHAIGTSETVLIREVSLFQRCTSFKRGSTGEDMDAACFAHAPAHYVNILTIIQYLRS